MVGSNCESRWFVPGGRRDKESLETGSKILDSILYVIVGFPCLVGSVTSLPSGVT
jgi:hypothetical protein